MNATQRQHQENESTNAPGQHSNRLSLLVFLLAVAAICVVSLFPEARFWGINRWGYFPLWIRAAVLLVIALSGFAAFHYLTQYSGDRTSLPPRTERIVVAIVAALFVASFILFRNQVHFLGDGYQLLSTLPSDQPYLKSRNFGGMLLPYAIMHLLGTPSRDTALLAYQIVSIGCGILFLALSYLLARLAIRDSFDRILLWLGICTGGYLLLFFGYVENYSTFILAVLIFCAVGMSVDAGRLSRWWLLPAYGLTIFFHIFGLVLLPAALYQFIKSAQAGSVFHSRSFRVTLWGGGAVVALAVFLYLTSTDLFIRFAFVSPITTRFTVDNYTLFSGRHLLDWLNLVMLLSPAFLLFIITTGRSFIRLVRENQPGLRFILFTAAILLGLAFVVDPFLGMARDWDLFATAGLALALIVFYTLTSVTGKSRRVIAVFCILLNVAILGPRVASMAIPDVGLRVAQNNIRFDTSKNLTFSYVVIDYVRNQYGLDSALSLQQAWDPLFPSDRLIDTGLTLLNSGHPIEARPYFRRATEVNAMNYSAWANLGRTYLETAQYDSATAALHIAAGINPYSTTIVNNLSWARFLSGDYKQAERSWLRARSLDTNNTDALAGLVSLYSATADGDKYAAYFDTLVRRPDAPPEYLLIVAEHYAAQNMFREANKALGRAMANGLDSLSVESIQARYPQLREQQ